MKGKILLGRTLVGPGNVGKGIAWPAFSSPDARVIREMPIEMFLQILRGRQMIRLLEVQGHHGSMFMLLSGDYT